MRIEVENDAIRARKRQEYNDLVEEMAQQGYEDRLEKISVLRANVYGFILFIVMLVISYGLFILIHGKENFDYNNILGPGITGLVILFIVYVSMIFVHEFIHGFFWHFPCEKKWGSIDFGFNPKNITPYCHCREALSVKQYFVGCIAPTVILGLIPIIIGIAIANEFVVFIGIINFIGGIGDMMVVVTLRKHMDCRLFDHPYEVGYAYFVKKSGEEAADPEAK